jgi:DNA-binding NarL/FixJ family response regulator
MQKLIRVIIADDHEIFRDGFRLMLSRNERIELVAEADNGETLVKLAKTHQPDVVITDIKMPRMDGIEATRQMVNPKVGLAVIGLSMFDQEDLIMEMLEAGAMGYLLKNAEKEEVMEAIETVYGGDRYFCHSTSQRMAHLLAGSRFSPFYKKEALSFTARELEIIQLICQEYTAREIGEKLYMSSRTVEGYRHRLLERMQVKNTVGLVIYAMQHNLYKPTM